MGGGNGMKKQSFTMAGNERSWAFKRTAVGLKSWLSDDCDVCAAYVILISVI